jgi:hypothetical protein
MLILKIGMRLVDLNYLSLTQVFGLLAGSFGIFQGFFTFIKGVYPRHEKFLDNYLSFVYDECKQVRKLGLAMACSSFLVIAVITGSLFIR